MSSVIAASGRPDSPSLPYSRTGRLEPWALRLLGVFAAVMMVFIVAVCLPVLVGGVSTDYLGPVILFGTWLPTLVLLALHLLFGRPVPFVRWAALGIRPAGPTFAVVGLLVALMVLVPAVTIAGSTALGLVDFAPASGAAAAALMVAPLFLLAMVTSLGEEIAWRGYVQSALAPLGFWRASLIIGVFWSLWHLPLTTALWVDGQMAGREVVDTSMTLLLAAIVFSAVRYLSGSVWPAVVGHAMLNTVLLYAYDHLITPTSQLADGAYWVYALVAWAAWGAAVGLVVRRVARRRSPELVIRTSDGT
jgi:uncharacterized protein